MEPGDECFVVKSHPPIIMNYWLPCSGPKLAGQYDERRASEEKVTGI